jgi:predicted TIM-barrel fold metal-dependent hydrolase
MPVRIDSHVHVYDYGYWPSKWFDYVALQWAEKQPGRSPADVRNRIEEGLADPGAENLIQQMDAIGIDHSVILTVDWELGMEQPALVPIEKVHAQYEAIKDSTGGRVLSFAGVDPRRENAVDLLEDFIRRGSVSGLKLYPPAGFFPYDDVVSPLYEICRSAGMPVAVHTGGTIGLLRPRFANPLFLQDVQRAFPDLVLWIAHSGCTWWWEEAVAVAGNGVRTYLELSGWQDVARLEEERFIRMLDDARRQIGIERLLFGSDHFSGKRVRGVESLKQWFEWFCELPERARRHAISFSHEEVDLILGENARTCLGV